MTAVKGLRVRSSRTTRLPHSGFTLVELLVVVAIMSILLSVLAVALGKVHDAARSFLCKNNFKTVTFEFTLFADENAGANRGDSDRGYVHGFRLEDFQESVYHIDEFWDVEGSRTAGFDASKQPLICPAGPTGLRRTAGSPCSDYAVYPVEDVSVAFNMRLHRASVRIGNRWVLYPVSLSGRILENPNVPLVFDADGAVAGRRHVAPYYAAPAAGDEGMYGGDRFWFPAARHGDGINVGFVGGHVLSSRDPLRKLSWDWAYQPAPEAGGRPH